MRFEQSFIENIRDRASIVEVIGEKIAVTRKGSSYLALCPFHNDSKPSMHISESKQIFKCFACGMGGDVFKFVSELESISFPEAIKTLAEKYGIALPQDHNQSYQKYDSYINLKDINKQACDIYQKYLWQSKNGEAGREYIRRRKISAAVLKKYKIGYAPNSFDFITKILAKDHSAEDIFSAGLQFTSSKNGKRYDFFRNRVLFPIFSVKNEVVGFGARSIDNQEPKYLNTSETPLFKKKNILYGLNFCTHDFVKNKTGYIVEGYLDVIACQEAGVPAVAPLGTALTEDQVTKLGRYINKFVLIFDGDEAGQRAALKSSSMMAGMGIDGAVLIMPDDLDPFDYIQQYGGDAFKELIESTKIDMYDFIIKSLVPDYSLSPAEINNVLTNFQPIFQNIKNEIVLGAFKQKVAKRLDVAISQLSALKPVRQFEKRVPLAKPPSAIVKIERNFVLLLCNNPSNIAKAATLIRVEDISDQAARFIYKTLIEIRHKTEIKFNTILGLFDNEKVKDFLINNSLNNDILQNNPQKQLDDYLCKLKMNSLNMEIKNINIAVKECVDQGNLNNLKNLQEKKIQLSIEKQNLSSFLEQ